MKYRRFGHTDLEVSEIGFGAWAIGGGAMIGDTAIGWGDADDEQSKAAIHRAFDLGVNFFDTADVYGLGHSEELLGQTIGKRKDVIIASKVGNVSRDGKFTVDYRKAHIIAACDASLKRLNREVIDYYQLHSARVTHFEEHECIEAMQELQAKGKIRYWGISLNTFDPAPEAEFFMKAGIGHGFQLVFNLVNQLALPVIAKSTAAGYGIIARMPLQFGLLTGKFDQQSSFHVNDHRSKRITRELVDMTNKALEPAWQLCSKYGVDKTRLAMSYIMSYPEISTVIPGIRTKEQADQNTQGFVQLDIQDRSMIASLAETSLVKLMDEVKKLG
jgi:Predicted oxidoreductases (related to aryl-alcohol dehydrogenases)